LRVHEEIRVRSVEERSAGRRGFPHEQDAHVARTVVPPESRNPSRCFCRHHRKSTCHAAPCHLRTTTSER
jgi:hypothetical protein